MIESEEEVGLMMTRLTSAVAEAGLGSPDVENLLGLAEGDWLRFMTGRPGRFLTARQERRARLATELIERLSRKLRGQDEVHGWLAGASSMLDGISPVEWAAADVDHLYAMVACLRAADL